MSDWGWVTIAYVVTYATLGGYAFSLMRRTRRLGRDSG